MSGSGATIEVRIADRELRAAFKRLQRSAGGSNAMMRAVGTGLVGNVQRRLGSGVLAAGWPALNPAYKAGKRNRNMLVESGGLRGSLSEEAGRDYARVGTNKIYAAIHQFGGVIRPKGGGHLAFALGGSFVKTKSVTIPARPFLTIEKEDEEMVRDVIFYHLQK